MNVSNVAALDAVSVGGQPAVTGAQPTAQQVARFETQLHAGNTYEAPSQGALRLGSQWHSAMSGAGHVAQDLRDEFAHAFETLEPEGAKSLRSMPIADVAQKMMQMMDHSTRMSLSAMNFTLLGSAQRVTEQSARTLYQQQS